jgi:hypothetical protein
MPGGHCGTCNKTVLDLGSIEQDDALARIDAAHEAGERICVRAVRHRATGRLVFGVAAAAVLAGCSSAVFDGPPTKTVTLVVPYHAPPDAGVERFEELMGDVGP